jgi:serine/threonine protein kinase
MVRNDLTCVWQAYDRSVDWWCLGAVLYEMLYGLPPFYSRNTAEMYDQILYQPLRLRVGPSEAAKRILKEVSTRLARGWMRNQHMIV